VKSVKKKDRNLIETLRVGYEVQGMAVPPDRQFIVRFFRTTAALEILTAPVILLHRLYEIPTIISVAMGKIIDTFGAFFHMPSSFISA